MHFRHVLRTAFVTFCCTFSASAQTAFVTVPTKAPHNAEAKVWCHVPSCYDPATNRLWRVLVYFGGRNCTGEKEASGLLGWREWSDAKGVFLVCPGLPEVGYAFLGRSYRPDLGKWTSRDPLGFPDGWNAMAYCGNEVSIASDLFGCETIWKPWSVPSNSTRDPSLLYGPKKTYVNGLPAEVTISLVYSSKWEETGAMVPAVGECTLSIETAMVNAITASAEARIRKDFSKTASIGLSQFGISFSGSDSISWGSEIGVSVAQTTSVEARIGWSKTIPEGCEERAKVLQEFCRILVSCEIRYENGSNLISTINITASDWLPTTHYGVACQLGIIE